MSGKRGLSDVIFSFANASNVTLSKAFCDRLSGHIQVIGFFFCLILSYLILIATHFNPID